MSETNNSGDKTLGAPAPKATLHLKRPIEQGMVRQSFSHGRSKAVVVEKVKRRSGPGEGSPREGLSTPAATSAASRAASLGSLEGGNETILVVEDDRLVRDYVLTQLRSLGYVTLEAANAAEALAIVKAGQAFDLLFTDVIMPGGSNGRQLADQLQGIKPGLRVLFTSGYTENAIIHHGRLDTGVMLLAKPYRKSEMAAMIRTALAG